METEAARGGGRESGGRGWGNCKGTAMADTKAERGKGSGDGTKMERKRPYAGSNNINGNGNVTTTARQRTATVDGNGPAANQNAANIVRQRDMVATVMAPGSRQWGQR